MKLPTPTTTDADYNKTVCAGKMDTTHATRTRPPKRNGGGGRGCDDDDYNYNYDYGDEQTNKQTNEQQTNKNDHLSF